MDQENTTMKDWQKRAALFILSQNVSLFGSTVVSFAIIWNITLTTSSGYWIMLATVCSMVPQVIVSLFGGVLADRYNRKMLIMVSDGFIAAATLLLAIAFLLGYGRMELVLLALIIRSIGSGIQSPAVSAIYPQLVPSEKLTKVQGINQTLNSVLLLLSPAVGGLLLGTIGIVACFFVDVVTAVIAIVIMGGISVEKVRDSSEDITIWEDLKLGIQYTFSHHQLRRIIICYLFSFFLITPAAMLSPLMVERTFGNEVWRLTANEMVWTVGSLIGGVYVSFKGEFKDKVRTVAICIIFFGILFGLLGISWNFYVFLFFMGAAGFFMPIISTAQTVLIQEITKPSVIGRVFSIVQIIASSAMPVAILIFGPLADVISVESIIIVTGVLLAIVGVVYGWGKGRLKEAQIPVSEE